MTSASDIVNLNVGGRRFSTSRQTLLWPQHSFFSSLLGGRIPTLKDEAGAIFIDRDPDLFGVILNYLRTNDLNLNGVDISAIRHEAQYYGLVSLVRKLALCEDNFYGSCGDVLFHGYIPAPELSDSSEPSDQAEQQRQRSNQATAGQEDSTPPVNTAATTTTSTTSTGFSNAVPLRPPPANDVLHRLRNSLAEGSSTPQHPSTSQTDQPGPSSTAATGSGASRKPSAGEKGPSSLPAARTQDIGGPAGNCVTDTANRESSSTDQRKVNLIRCHQNWLAAAYPNHVGLFMVKDLIGRREVWLSPSFEGSGGVSLVTLNAKVGGVGGREGGDLTSCMIGVASGSSISLWRVSPVLESGPPASTSASAQQTSRQVGQFDLGGRRIDDLFFIGSQLVALSRTGRVGVWHSMTHNWQIQDVAPIHSYDVAGSEFLLLGCQNGCIYFIDMQKFPLRIVDNDLLVTKLHTDPKKDAVTALSVYVTPKTKNEIHQHVINLFLEVRHFCIQDIQGYDNRHDNLSQDYDQFINYWFK